MIQIQFLDKNVVGALVPAFSMKPERVVFLYDTRVISENVMREIRETLTDRMPQVKVQYESTNMLSFDKIRETLDKIIKSYANKEIQIDITGGSEIMVACGLMVAKEYSFVASYVDFYSETVRNAMTMERMAKIIHVSLSDYLTALGGKLLSTSRYTPQEKEYERILSMANIIFSNEKKWDKFFAHITHGYSSRGVMEFSLGSKQEDKDCRFILEAFIERGYAKKIGEDRYRFASEIDKEYMTVSGIWLELYVYIQAKKCYDEVYMGVDIDWNKRDICESRDNEIDVVVMEKSQPIFISCKMRPVEKEHVYEIYAMSKRLAGCYGRSLIATTSDIRSGKNERNSIYLRMAKMKVGLIEAKDFIKKNASDVFANALRMNI